MNAIQIRALLSVAIGIVGCTKFDRVDSDSKSRTTLSTESFSSTNRIIIGDSIVKGGNWQTFTHKLAVNGATTDRIIREVKALPKKEVFLLLGINDIAKKYSSEKSLSLFQRITELFPNSKVSIISVLPVNMGVIKSKKIFKNLVGRPDLNTQIRELNFKLKEAISMGRLRAHFIDIAPEMTDIDGQLKKQFTKNGIHLSERGYIALKGGIEKKSP